MTGHPTVSGELASMLDHLAHTVVTTLGFGVAVVTLRRLDGRMQVASVAGDGIAAAALLGTVDSGEAWDSCVAADDAEGRLRFLRRAGSAGNDARRVHGWHPEDALLVPLVASDGTRLGVLTVIVRRHDRTPEQAARTALEAFAVSAAMAIEHATLRSRAEASERIFRSQAMTDPLTGVGSRALLLERLRHAGTARPESGAVMALAFIDLDGFKAINDEHTHATGDHVLRTVAERIQTAVRAHDTVARWGGDEFLVLLHPLNGEHSALGAVQRILDAIAEPISHHGHVLTVTASIGVSFRRADAALEPEELVQRADAAMYEAKHQGANGFAVFDALDAESSRRLHLLDLLARAVTEERVVVQFQPIVQVSDRRVVGVEALLRLRDDDGSLVLPLELLDRGAPPVDVAQEVMLTACAQVARWVGQGHDLWLSLNVSAQQVADIDGFVADVGRALTQTGLEPRRLMLELTEHALLSTTDRTLQGVHELVEAGVRFSIDDFGTGFGSMTYVQTMPIHELKIDQSFVRAAVSQRPAAAIVRSIAGLARDLGIGCVAEGVEDAVHHDLVRDSGVALAQGLHYSSALDPSALEPLLGEVRTADAVG